MKTVLIAGATGYLGRYLVQHFHQQGWQVRALARRPEKLQVDGKALAPSVSPFVERIVPGDITRPHTLEGACEGVDAVVSSVSLMAQGGSLTWHDVDYLGNLNLLREAENSECERFLYFSVFQAESLSHVPMVRAHEDFVRELRRSEIRSTVIRPTGFFSDLAEFFQMARQGRVYLLGDGSAQVNPIHGQDLAEAAYQAFLEEVPERSLGGPEILDWNRVAQLAFSTQGKAPKLTHIPLPLARGVVEISRRFVRRKAELWDFFVSSSSLDFVAPQKGTRRLGDFYAKLMHNP